MEQDSGLNFSVLLDMKLIKLFIFGETRLIQ